MRALFYVPPPQYNRRGTPVDRVYGCNHGFDYKPPIHFLTVATWIRERAGWDVVFLDCPAEGMNAEAFEKYASEHHFDVSCAWSVYLSAEEDLKAADVLRRYQPKQRQVFMGTAATWKPEEFIRDSSRFCLLGEAEITLLELAESWSGESYVREGEAGRTRGRGPTPLALASMDGLAFWDGEKVQRGAFRQLMDVSSLPIPDRRLLKGRYHANRLDVGPITTMVVSRGCGFRCTFCTPNAVDQQIELEFKRLQPTYVERPPLRKRTVDQIVAEFEEIAALGYRGIEVADNIFTWGNTRTRQLCERIRPLNLQWICLARANMLHDASTVKAMAEAGCKMVYMGSESFDDGLLDDMQKELKVKDVVKAVEVCRANGLEPEVSVLMGASPKETPRTLYNSWKAARKLGTPFVHYSVALPSPSTELYDMAIQNGWFIHGDFVPADNTKDVIVNLPHLSANQLRLALKLAYATQYLRPKAVMHHLRQVDSVTALQQKARSALGLFRFLGEGNRLEHPPIPPGRVTP